MTSSYSEFDLTFPMVEYGSTEIPWDLRPLLFRGGAAANARKVAGQIAQHELGKLLEDRVELVQQLHSNMANDLAIGGSRYSAQNKILAMRQLFTWADQMQLGLTLETVSTTFLLWADYLVHRQRVNGLREGTSYDTATLVATMLDRVLNRHASLIKETRIHKPRSKRKLHATAADKQSLEASFAFGHLLADLCNALTLEATLGPLPVRIPLRGGQILEQWSRLPKPERVLAQRTKPQSKAIAEASRLTRAAWEADRTLRTRYPLVNLRIEAELLMFIAQTGMNFQQAHTLHMDQYHYTSHLDGYQVRAYKHRRQGEVLFEIFANYRTWFERYLSWRAAWFPDDLEGLLFPLIRSGGRIEVEPPQFTCLLRVCKIVGSPLIRARKLRGTRVNWLLNESCDPHQTAEMAQHTVETLIRVYADPHPQIAMVEIARFHSQTDPHFAPPGPGVCVAANPEPILDLPAEAPMPDCISSAGCLFCTHHRDIESADHVWSLSSFRHLKLLELASYRPPQRGKLLAPNHPALVTVERLTAKLQFFEQSSTVRRAWVNEAKERLNEGDYHPAWDGFIRLSEIHHEGV